MLQHLKYFTVVRPYEDCKLLILFVYSKIYFHKTSICNWKSVFMFALLMSAEYNEGQRNYIYTNVPTYVLL